MQRDAGSAVARQRGPSPDMWAHDKFEEQPVREYRPCPAAQLRLPTCHRNSIHVTGIMTPIPASQRDLHTATLFFSKSLLAMPARVRVERSRVWVSRSSSPVARKKLTRAGISFHASRDPSAGRHVAPNQASTCRWCTRRKPRSRRGTRRARYANLAAAGCAI